MTNEQQQASAGEVPTVMTIDAIFDLLQTALNKAVDAHGDPAKAFAWDVRQHFLSEIGHYRTRVTAPARGEG